MKQVTKLKPCHKCKHSIWKDYPKRGRMLMCEKDNCCAFELYAQEDWRDKINLEKDSEDLTKDQRRQRAEIENPHIVQIRKDILKERAIEKRKQEILADIRKNGGINGMKLV